MKGPLTIYARMSAAASLRSRRWSAVASSATSLTMPSWAAKYLLMNFNLHELHHMFVRVPGYALHKIYRKTLNEVDWLRWTVESRRVNGTEFLFSNRDQTGVKL